MAIKFRLFWNIAADRSQTHYLSPRTFYSLPPHNKVTCANSSYAIYMY